jgi:hypothetical protein
MRIKNFLRSFVAIWYLLGWMVHVYLGLENPDLYSSFGRTGIIPGYEYFWTNWIMPSIVFWALLLAGFELCVGMLLIHKKKWVKVGLVFSILFNLFLVQMGLGYQTTEIWIGFLSNRLPNLIMVMLQLPLLWGTYSKSIFETITSNQKTK